jgi:hypothetical protein
MVAQGDSYLDPRQVFLYRNKSRNLCLRIEGRGEWEKIAVRRAFPYSEPESYIVFQSDDEELGVLRDPSELDAESYALLDITLRKRYHIPVILRIVSVEETHNATKWQVETDMGPRSFEVHSRRSFRSMREGELVIIDVDANRFRVPDRHALDRASRDLLEMHV